jgi:hypothetical protein
VPAGLLVIPFPRRILGLKGDRTTAKDVGWMAAYYGWRFQTKLELAAARIEWLVQRLGPDRPPIRVVTDGAHASPKIRRFIQRLMRRVA